MLAFKFLAKRVVLLAAVAAMSYSFADERLSPEDFVDEALSKGMAEIKTAEIALETSTSSDVREYAKKMIKDHSSANEELATIARTKALDVSDDVALMNKAKALILELRDGESFDIAYANNQVRAHEETIALFVKAALSTHSDIKSFANKTLPTLEQHLADAYRLVETTKAEAGTHEERGSYD